MSNWRPIAIFQGLYFLIAGVWPLVSMESFLQITGPKTDLWLVNTVGLLLAVTGSVLILSGIRGKFKAETFLLAVGSALCLASIEIYYVSAKIIGPVYLLDSAIELILIALWLNALRGRRKDSEQDAGRGP